MNENLNLVEILKDCPEGTKLYSTIFGEVEFGGISQTRTIYPVDIKLNNNLTECLTPGGRIYTEYAGECILFPSKDQRDWGKFNPKKGELVPPCKFKVGDWIVFNGLTLYIKEVVKGFYRTISKGDISNSYDWDIDNIARLWTIQDAKDGDVLEFGDHGRLVVGIVSYINKSTGKVDVYCLLEDNKFKPGVFYNLDTINPYPATKEQRDVLMEAMNDAGYEWDVEKKELKLVKPKFKVGDKIVNTLMKYMGADRTTGTISEITDDKYIFSDGSYICIGNQGSWELVQDKKDRFDPKTLQSFDRVLVRNCNSEHWRVQLFSHIAEHMEKFPYVCINTLCEYCIPYNEETKHLLGTTEEAPKHYRYWED